MSGQERSYVVAHLCNIYFWGAWDGICVKCKLQRKAKTWLSNANGRIGCFQYMLIFAISCSSCVPPSFQLSHLIHAFRPRRWDMTSLQVSSLLAWFNVHSLAGCRGEVRGWLGPARGTLPPRPFLQEWLFNLCIYENTQILHMHSQTAALKLANNPFLVPLAEDRPRLVCISAALCSALAQHPTHTLLLECRKKLLLEGVIRNSLAFAPNQFACPSPAPATDLIEGVGHGCTVQRQRLLPEEVRHGQA
eukprot:1158532-Pelagomonas_calceolata.AAC.4